MARKHSDRAHAKLSASASHRWLACPPSAKLCADLPDTATDYAKEGTCAHELAEYKVNKLLGIDAADPTEHAWRDANPNITALWWAVDYVVKKAVKEKTTTTTHGIRFICKSGMLFIELPSGRRLAYVKPRIGENKFGGESVTYEGSTNKKWERLESYGPKFVENIVQAIARDILCYALQTLSHVGFSSCADTPSLSGSILPQVRACFIVAHVHDEIILEADRRMSVEAVCEQMARVPDWAEGLQLRADGYECEYYKKD